LSKPCDLSAIEARRLIGIKALSPVELLDSCLERIAEANNTLNAVVAMDEKVARANAGTAEKAVTDGEDLGLLHGLPVGIKDLNATANLKTTWGSLIYKDHVPAEDDHMVANVRAAGANVFAKTNTPEFGAGANTTNRVYGPTGNPFDAERTCAGSSGGSAAALAAGMMPLATGSDYGGSLRTPAAFCGVTGFRPSPGVVPAVGRPISLNPFSVVGPMGRTVADTHLLLLAQQDSDLRDPFSSMDDLDIPATLAGADLTNLRVAISTDLGCAPVDKHIAETFEQRTAKFSHVFRDTQTRNPRMHDVHDAFEITRGVYFVGAHGDRLEHQRDLLDRNVIDNTERGLKYSLGDVAWAHTVQTKIYNDFIELFEEVDILICPTASVSPFPHSQLFVEEINGDKMPTYMRWLALSYALTMALPAVCALPCGVDHLGMPFGIQVVGPNGSDALVLEVAHSLEQLLADDPETARPVAELATLNA
jgi:Asp-tRNA(Asn)/Glu-tRNA(Gln) amidotransferase A subunit family amidase